MVEVCEGSGVALGRMVMPVVALGAASGAGPQAASRMAIRMSRLAFNPMVFIAVIGDIPM